MRVIVLYAAAAVFLAGFLWRVLSWLRVPVPFHIPVTDGHASPPARLAREVFLFGSLFRNRQAELHPGPRLVFGEEKILWLAAMAFHWSLLVILLRHLRFIGTPLFFLQRLDGFFEIGMPVVYMSNVAIVAALAYLLLRRLLDARLRYLSLVADYAVLLLLLTVVLTGVWMRHVARTDIMAVKQSGSGPGLAFQLHLYSVCALLVSFPFSKLMHAPGIFLSPTRNLANNSRRVRHVNPWNAPVAVHSYPEWEAEYRDKIEAAGLPLDNA